MLIQRRRSAWCANIVWFQQVSPQPCDPDVIESCYRCVAISNASLLHIATTSALPTHQHDANVSRSNRCADSSTHVLNCLCMCHWRVISRALSMTLHVLYALIDNSLNGYVACTVCMSSFFASQVISRVTYPNYADVCPVLWDKQCRVHAMPPAVVGTILCRISDKRCGTIRC